MKFVDDFRNPDLALPLVAQIEALLARINPSRPLQIMEFCGGHTHAIFRYGLHQLLPQAIEWVHGPGCPVCVLPRERVDACIEIARQPKVILTTFGDAVRVPGTELSLADARAAGCQIQVVYSPLDALALSRRYPDREVVFFALGFETTMPATALTVLQAAKQGIGNFSVLCQHITTPAAVRSVLSDPDLVLDGILGPGHVSTVLGARAFQFIAEEFAIPVVISGFEPLDILQSLWLLLKQIDEGRSQVDNQYRRAVTDWGNPAGLAAIERVFELSDHCQWRGLGGIPRSGVRLRHCYAGFDAERRFGVVAGNVREENLPCGEVLKGRLKPWQCPHFVADCRPDSPLGALMVSSEGACSAYHRYARRQPAP